MRHVVRRIARHQRIEIVAADPALHLREFIRDLGRLALAEREHVAKQRKRGVGRVHLGEVARHFAEMHLRSVRERGIQRQRVVAHGAVAQRPPAAGIVAGHAADGGARRRGDVDRKPQPVLFQLPVEIVEHDAGLDHARPILDIEREDAAQVFREVDNNAVIDGLAALRGAAAARRDDPPVVPGNGERPQGLVHGARHDHALGHDLVERCIGRVAAAAEAIEQHLAGYFAGQPGLKRGGCVVGHACP